MEEAMIYQTQNTIVGIARERAAQHPERNYVTFLADGEAVEDKISYGELGRSAEEIAGWIQKQRLVKGDRVVLLLPNGLEFVKVFYGCLFSGVLAVPLSHQLQAYRETLIPNLEISRPKLIISTRQVADFLQERLSSEADGAFAGIKIVSATKILEDNSHHFQDPGIHPEDPAYLQFSSGSTGAPKGVIVGHSNIMANMEQSRIFGHWEENNGTSLWLPLFHDFGLAAGLIGSMYIGGFVILMSPVHFIMSPIRWLLAMSRYQCSHSFAPPFAFETCLRKVTPLEAEQLDLSSMVSIIIGSEPVHYLATKAFNDFFAKAGLKPNVVRPGFGMAETVIMFSVSHELEVLCADRDVLETENRLLIIEESAAKEEKKFLINLGPEMHGHEMVIMSEDGKQLPEGEVGEITLSGPSVCFGYYQNETASQQTFGQQIKGFDTPFLRTGDRGLLWKGNLYFSGRIKDIIIIRGRNCYPHDIEFAIQKVDSVCPDCAIAYGLVQDEQDEQLAIAMEIESEYLVDLEAFQRDLLPEIDRQIVKTLGDHFQIYPTLRTYLRPGTIKKTSSGKIKHSSTVALISQDEFHGLVIRLTGEKVEELAELCIRETLKLLYLKIIGQEPILDQPLVEIAGDSMKIVELVEAIGTNYPISGFDLLDHIEENTTIEDIISLIEDEDLRHSIPM